MIDKLRILELFGGIGACTVAVKKMNIPFEVVDYVEIDKYAVKSYNAMNGTDFNPSDICDWDKDIEVDLIMHGSPCQDFSIAGKQAGGNLGSGTRSSLMYETIRIVKKLKPKYVIWENVKNILNENHKHNLDNYIRELDESSYNSYHEVLNAKDYGLPQNRERVFVVSIRKDIDDKKFIFPEKQKLELRLKDMLEDVVDEKYYMSEQISFEATNKIRETKEPSCIRVAQLNIKGPDIIKRVYGVDGISPTLTAMEGGHRQPKTIQGDRIRKLTPKECWRLMGFDDLDFENAARVNSDSQLYKQAGNSICISVIEAILKNLIIDKKRDIESWVV